MRTDPNSTKDVSAAGLRIAVATAMFNESIASGLKTAAIQFLNDHDAKDVVVVDVPGAFELPIVAQALVRSGCDAVVCLGAVIKGDTDHYEHVANRASEGLMRVQLETGVPISFGILTVIDYGHALERSKPGPQNAGAHAAAAAVRTAQILAGLRDTSTT